MAPGDINLQTQVLHVSGVSRGVIDRPSEGSGSGCVAVIELSLPEGVQEAAPLPEFTRITIYSSINQTIKGF